MVTEERIDEARGDLESASEALDCFLEMLGQMSGEAKVSAAGLKTLLLPVFGNVNAALSNIS